MNNLTLQNSLLSCIYIDLLRPSDSIRQHKTLDQVIAFWLMAPSHYLNQYWLRINTRYSGIHSRVMFTWILEITIPKLCLKFTHLKARPPLSGDNKSHVIWKFSTKPRLASHYTFCVITTHFECQIHLYASLSKMWENYAFYEISAPSAQYRIIYSNYPG